jgi:hypothetical protein
MVPVLSLWLPILLAAIIVFVASSVIHMFTPFHKGDVRKAPNEDAALDAIRALNLPPGDYAMPLAGSMEDFKNPAYLEKLAKGPVVFMTVSPGRAPSMAANLIQWFVYGLAVSVFAAYVAGRALSPGAHYLAVFRFAGTTAFLGYAMALAQQSIWWKKNWGATLRSMADGLLYALLTAATFGWLWPR